MVSLAVTLAAVVVALVVLDLAFKFVYREPESADEPADERHTVETEDGLELELWRHLPEGDVSEAEPVFLLHGLGTTHRSLNFDDDVGLAQYLAEHGYDCWLLDLRGRYGSDAPGGWLPFKPWSFDDYYEYDVPAALDYVLDETGADDVHWVGHSMGGMLYYAVAGTGGRDDDVRSAVTLGSPIVIEHGRVLSALSLLGVTFSWMLSRLKRLHFLPALGRVLSVFYPVLPKGLVAVLFNKPNTETNVTRRASTECVSRMTPMLLDDFARWITYGDWDSRDGEVDYAAGVEEIETPTLVVAGAYDHLVPFPDVESAYYALEGAEEREFYEAGTAQGFEHEYAHADLVFGRNVREELYPDVADWLDEH
ncbi:MAG: alpha/beta fold hydrolase [Halobacteriota archaeon]